MFGCFYEQELAKVRNSDVYLIEKVLKKCGNKLHVKSRENSEKNYANVSLDA